MEGVAYCAEHACAERKAFGEALEAPDKEEWIKGLKEEMNSLQSNATWEARQLPPGRKAIGSKWGLRPKKRASGDMVRHKARLAAKGCAQAHAVDYEEAFSPVARYESLRAALAWTSCEEMHIGHCDIKAAGLSGILEEEIYMQKPGGFADDNVNEVLKLPKASFTLVAYGARKSA